jgi:hypothetical protein
MRNVPFVLSPLLLVALAACDEEPPPITGRMVEEALDSAIVGAGYVLRVRLPPGYDDDPGATYPVVVQLDPTFAGLRELDITAGLISEHAADGSWPEAIVVGIDDAGENQRLRDYVLPEPPDPDYSGGNADRFFRAIRDEILPHVEASYRVDASLRILIGHSAGATFAWYAAFRHAPPDPPLFVGVLAADVGLEESIFTYERWHAERSTSLPLRLYSASALFNGALEKITVDAMSDRLDDRDYDDLELVMETLETDHGGIIQPSFERGLDFIFGGAR